MSKVTHYFAKQRPLTRGFSLIELLVVVTIIGLLSTVGMVSYEGARRSSRDGKRVSDVQQIQQSLELYFEFNQGYPSDETNGPDGLALGNTETSNLSDAGFAEAIKGTVFMQGVPSNPGPNGAPYVYRSVNRDGTDCNFSPCDSYAIYFSLEDEMGSLQPGPHALTPQGMVGSEGGSAVGVTGASFWSGMEGASEAIGNFGGQAFSAWSNLAADPTAQIVTEAAVAPVVAVAAAANFAVAIQSVVSTASFGQYLIFFLTQPALLLMRKRRRHWGAVYNALSHLPEDLAIVRLRLGKNNRVIKSSVTDKDGRFSFIVPAGDYRLEVSKAGLIFPSNLTVGRQEDGQYLDIYHGETLQVGAEGGVLTPNIPLDPIGKEGDDGAALKYDRLKSVRSTMAAFGPMLGGLALALRPSWVVATLFVLQIFIYAMFRRVAIPPRPKNWGVIFDEQTRHPVKQAIVRVFALPYHKLLETAVTDERGRYNFRVGTGKYYLTVTKAAYLKTESEPIDFAESDKPLFIAADIPMRRVGAVEQGAGSGEESAPVIAEPILAPTPAPVSPPPPAPPPIVQPMPAQRKILDVIPEISSVASSVEKKIEPESPNAVSEPLWKKKAEEPIALPTAPPPSPAPTPFIVPKKNPNEPFSPVDNRPKREISVKYRDPSAPSEPDRHVPPAGFVA